MFADVTCKQTAEGVKAWLEEIEEARKPRATLIQAYSRQSAKSTMEREKTEIKL